MKVRDRLHEDLQEVTTAPARPEPADPTGVYKQLHKILRGRGSRGQARSMAKLAAIEGFKLFVGTTFDLLLSRAVEAASPRRESRGATRRQQSAPAPAPTFRRSSPNSSFPFVYGYSAQSSRTGTSSWWDDDVFRFLLRLDQQLPQLPRLLEALQGSHLLVLGLRFDHWLLRFFVQVREAAAALRPLGQRSCTCSSSSSRRSETASSCTSSRLTKKIHVRTRGSIAFISELHARWRRKHPAARGDPYLPRQGADGSGMARAAASSSATRS